jgi:hypothetical protein
MMMIEARGVPKNRFPLPSTLKEMFEGFAASYAIHICLYIPSATL